VEITRARTRARGSVRRRAGGAEEVPAPGALGGADDAGVEESRQPAVLPVTGR
jgi:hypothetical protein